MKKIAITILYACLILPFTVQLEAQDKPEIQVNFDLAADVENPSFLFRIGDLNQFKQEVLPILIAGLKKYIGFVDFDPSEGDYQLNITLINTNTNDAPAYGFTFRSTDLNKDSSGHTWKFLNNSDFEAVVNSADFLCKLNNDWVENPVNSPYQPLLSNFFSNIPFSLPDNGYYHLSGVVKQAILPFKKDSIMIDYENSEFEISTTYLNSQGDSLTLKRNGKGIGEVKTQVLPNPDLLGCIRIEIRDFPKILPLHGKIFFLDYKRELINTIATTADFMDSNNSSCHE